MEQKEKCRKGFRHCVGGRDANKSEKWRIFLLAVSKKKQEKTSKEMQLFLKLMEWKAKRDVYKPWTIHKCEKTWSIGFTIVIFFSKPGPWQPCNEDNRPFQPCKAIFQCNTHTGGHCNLTSFLPNWLDNEKESGKRKSITNKEIMLILHLGICI